MSARSTSQGLPLLLNKLRRKKGNNADSDKDPAKPGSTAKTGPSTQRRPRKLKSVLTSTAYSSSISSISKMSLKLVRQDIRLTLLRYMASTATLTTLGRTEMANCGSGTSYLNSCQVPGFLHLAILRKLPLLWLPDD